MGKGTDFSMVFQFDILVGNACGGGAGAGPILPETFAGDNSTMRIKWIRVFKPSNHHAESK